MLDHRSLVFLPPLICSCSTALGQTRDTGEPEFEQGEPEGIERERGEGPELVAGYACECFGKFEDGDTACEAHTGALWLPECTDWLFSYISDVPCDEVSTDTQVADGAYYAAWYGRYAWWDGPVYANGCFDEEIALRAASRR